MLSNRASTEETARLVPSAKASGDDARAGAHDEQLARRIRWLFGTMVLAIVAGVAIIWNTASPTTVPIAAALATGTASSSSAASHEQQQQQDLWYPAVSSDDFGPYQEYSVIHTDRSLNLMSQPFREVMCDLNRLLKTTYNADKVAIVPGCVRACYNDMTV